MFQIVAKGNTVVEMFECPRCGGEHRDLEIMVMAQPMRVADFTFHAWAWCPTMSDPIMLARTENTYQLEIEEPK